MSTCYYCGQNECRCARIPPTEEPRGDEIRELYENEIEKLNRQIDDLAMACAARDELERAAKRLVKHWERHPERTIAYTEAGERAQAMLRHAARNVPASDPYSARIIGIHAEIARLRSDLNQAADLVTALVRADNNRTGKGPGGRITGADTLPLQQLLGLALTLREPFGDLGPSSSEGNTSA